MRTVDIVVDKWLRVDGNMIGHDLVEEIFDRLTVKNQARVKAEEQGRKWQAKQMIPEWILGRFYDHRVDGNDPVFNGDWVVMARGFALELSCCSGTTASRLGGWTAGTGRWESLMGSRSIRTVNIKRLLLTLFVAISKACIALLQEAERRPRSAGFFGRLIPLLLSSLLTELLSLISGSRRSVTASESPPQRLDVSVRVDGVQDVLQLLQSSRSTVNGMSQKYRTY